MRLETVLIVLLLCSPLAGADCGDSSVQRSDEQCYTCKAYVNETISELREAQFRLTSIISSLSLNARELKGLSKEFAEAADRSSLTNAFSIKDEIEVVCESEELFLLSNEISALLANLEKCSKNSCHGEGLLLEELKEANVELLPLVENCSSQLNK